MRRRGAIALYQYCRVIEAGTSPQAPPHKHPNPCTCGETIPGIQRLPWRHTIHIYFDKVLAGKWVY